MANEPVNSGDKIEVAGQEGTVVRSVAIQGGVEYTVRVADENAAATQPVKLPPGYNPVAAYGTEEEAAVHEENRKRDEEDRAKLEKAITDERKAYVEREQKLTGEWKENAEDDADAGAVSHLVSAEATKQVEDERRARDGKERVRATSQETSPSSKPASQAADTKASEAGKRNR